MMLLSPQTEAALLAILCTGHPSMADLFHVQNLQAELIRRARVRQTLDEQSARTKEFNP